MKDKRKTIIGIIATAIFIISLLNNINLVSATNPSLDIISISTDGDVEYGANISLTIGIKNLNNDIIDDLVLKFPNVYGENLLFSKNNSDEFSLDRNSIIYQTVDLFINCSSGDFELVFYVEYRNSLITYRIYHLIVDELENIEPGIYNATIYNNFMMNITIQNFVDNILNNNITIYQDMFNEIFNYFNMTLYNNINQTIYNEMYNDIYNEINNSFYVDVVNLIDNNVENINEINNTLLTELYEYIYNEVNVTVSNVVNIPEEDSLDVPEILGIVFASICVSIGLLGIMFNPSKKIFARNFNTISDSRKKELIKIEYETGGKEGLTVIKNEYDKIKSRNQIVLGIGFITIPLTYYCTYVYLFSLLSPFGGNYSPFLQNFYSIIWTATIFILCLAISNKKSRYMFFISVIAIISCSSWIMGLSLIILTFAIKSFVYIIKNNEKFNLSKKSDSNAYFNI